MTEIVLARPNTPELRAAHDLFRKTFRPEEMDNLDTFQRYSGQPDAAKYRLIVPVVKDGERVVAAASGTYLPTMDSLERRTGGGFGWLEYLATTETERGKGYGNAVVEALEEEIMRIHDARNFMGLS